MKELSPDCDQKQWRNERNRWLSKRLFFFNFLLRNIRFKQKSQKLEGLAGNKKRVSGEIFSASCFFTASNSNKVGEEDHHQSKRNEAERRHFVKIKKATLFVRFIFVLLWHFTLREHGVWVRGGRMKIMKHLITIITNFSRVSFAPDSSSVARQNKTKNCVHLTQQRSREWKESFKYFLAFVRKRARDPFFNFPRALIEEILTPLTTNFNTFKLN